MTDANAQILSLDLRVSYRQAYLVDDTDDAECPGMVDDHPDHPVGILRVEEGSAFLVTGTHTGTVRFDVAVAESEPAPDRDGHEDIVEISIESKSGSFTLHEWGGEAHEIPALAAGPGWYRLRYHAAGMDDGPDGVAEGLAPDRYLLQIWPAPESDPVVVKSASGTHQHWMTAG
ncbi:hypothetical protein [Nonomuraea recticatena]|uniref:Uncharacterized protein n=1 Tax=Nonomuraea recticatena TaxID=46178 RepID=A0ABN3RIR4_9ACTN